MIGQARVEAVVDDVSLPARWWSGRCARNHDITVPANRTRVGRRRQWLCVLCERYRAKRLRCGLRVGGGVS